MTTYGVNGFGSGSGPARFAAIADIARVADDLIERRFVGKAVLGF